jgi:DNA primase
MVRMPTETDARELLISSGVRFSDKGDYYSIFCPFHQNTKTASAVLYKDRWLFKCFGCGTTFSFVKLYEALKNKSWDEQGSFNMVPVPVRDTMTDDARRTFAIEEGRITSVYDNAKALAYCRSRSVDDSFMQFFKLQATDLCKFKKADKDDPVTIWQDRLLIPINFNDQPYNLEGRDYTRKQIPKCLYPKYCKMDICFNQENLDKSKPLIVCEGIMDIHKIWSAIDKNVTCTFGMSVSGGQRKFLKDAKNIILFIDDDEAGHKSVGIFESFMNSDFRVAIVPGTDPGGATLTQLNEALSKTTLWVNFLMEEAKLFDKSARSTFSLHGINY